MKISNSALATLSLIAPFLLLESVNGDTQAGDSPARMQRLTRRNTVDLSSSSSSSTLSKRNATTFVPRQDKVDSTVSNTTTSSSTIGDIVEKQYNEQVSTSHGSPYNIKAVLELLHQGFMELPKQAQALVRRGEGGDDKDNGKMSTTSVTTTNNDEEECEEEEDEDDEEQCEEEGDDDDDEECEDDNDDDEEECDAEGDDGDEEDCEDEEDGAASPIGGVVDFSAIPTPNNLAQGSRQSKDGCTKFATAVSGDTCYKLIGARDDELLKVFYKNNPSVDSGCKNLKVDSAYCVSSAPVSAPVSAPAQESKKEETKKEEEQKPVVAVPTPPSQQNNVVNEVNPDVKVETPVAVVVDVKKDENLKKEDNNGSAKKNDYDAKASYYFQKGNAGACGNKKSDSDYIVALHPSLYNNGARCGQKISVTNKSTGKTIVAEVQDLCPTCEGSSPGPQIDLSKKLFDDLSNGADGIFQVTYGFL